MRAYFTDDQLLHDPQQFMRLGRIVKPSELPSLTPCYSGSPGVARPPRHAPSISVIGQEGGYLVDAIRPARSLFLSGFESGAAAANTALRAVATAAATAARKAEAAR